MDKDQKSQSPNDRPNEKKPSQPSGGNLVWYMLGLGVLLLLMVTLFNSTNDFRPGWSDLIKLVEASGKNGTKTVDVDDNTTSQPTHWRISDLSDVQIGTSEVRAK